MFRELNSSLSYRRLPTKKYLRDSCIREKFWCGELLKYPSGSRVDKYWFMVRDTSLKTDRLLTLVPLNRNCPLTVCPSTKDILNNLFLALQHPYICPVFQVDFLEYEDQTYIVLVQPINQGSLKDLIYGVSISWRRNRFSFFRKVKKYELHLRTSWSIWN